jgi:Fur family transcriptional regulator, ferric uptake regulator
MIPSLVPVIIPETTNDDALSQKVAGSYRMTHQQIDYVERIRNAGYRVTIQRLLILDAVCDGGGHSTIGAIIAQVREVDRNIDKSTVYRVLEFLREVGLVTSATTAEGTVYEIASDHPHHHLVCERCGKTRQIEDDGWLAQLSQKYGFTVTANHLMLTGICEACQ